MTQSIPSMSSSGNDIPQSTTIMLSSYSKAVIFIPICSRPPRGMILSPFIGFFTSLLVFLGLISLKFSFGLLDIAGSFSILISSSVSLAFFLLFAADLTVFFATLTLPSASFLVFLYLLVAFPMLSTSFPNFLSLLISDICPP